MLVDSVRWRGVGASVFLIHSTNFQHAFYSCVDSLRWRRVRVPVCLRHSTIPQTDVSTVYRFFEPGRDRLRHLYVFGYVGVGRLEVVHIGYPKLGKWRMDILPLIHFIETFENSIWLNI